MQSLFVIIVLLESDVATDTQATKKPKIIPKIFNGKFYVIENETNGSIKARCTECNSIIKGQLTSTGNFIKHYHIRHPTKLDELKNNKKTVSDMSKHTSHQPTLIDIAKVVKSDEVHRMKFGYN